MKQSHIPLFVFVALLILTTTLSSDGFSLDLTTSVVPGWHTTIFPPYFLLNSVVSIILLLVTIAVSESFKEDKKNKLDGLPYSFNADNSCSLLHCLVILN